MIMMEHTMMITTFIVYLDNVVDAVNDVAHDIAHYGQDKLQEF